MSSEYKVYIFVSLFLLLSLGIFVTAEIIDSEGSLLFLFILSSIGFAVSWFNQDEERIKYIRLLVGVFSLFISLRLAFVSAYQNKPIVSESLRTLMYLGAVSSFMLYRLRDCYFLFLLSALLLVFSAVISSISPNLFLVYILFFVILCMIFIRSVSYEENLIPIRQSLQETRRFLTNDLLNIIKLSFAIIFVAIPIYFFIPRFNIPLPLLPALKYEQNKIFIDIIGSGVSSFFGKDKRKIIVGPHKIKEDSENFSGSNFKEDSKEQLIGIGKDEMRPVFWHGLEAASEGLENAKSRQEPIEQEIRDKTIDINNYDALSKRLIDKIKSINEQIIDNQSSPALKKETERLLSQRQNLIDKKIESEIKVQSLKRDIEDFNKLKNNAEDGLRSQETLRKQIELEDKITKFNKIISDNQWSLYKNKIYNRQVTNKIKDSYEHLSKLADNAQDKQKQDSLLIQLQKLENDLEYAAVKKTMLNKQSEDLGRLYMYLEEFIAKKDESFKERSSPDTKEKKWLFFENNPFVVTIGIFSLKVIYLLSLLFVFVIAIYFLYKLIKLFYLNIRKIRELKNLAYNEPKLFITGLYRYLLDILDEAGYKCKSSMDASEYFYFIVNKIPNINEPFSGIAKNFLEACYSNHDIRYDEAKRFTDDYRAVIREINKAEPLKKKILLRLKFPFQDIPLKG